MTRAAYVTYSSQTLLLAGANSAGTPVVSTETFDEFPSLTTFPSPTTLSGVTYTTPGAPAPPSTYEAVGGSFWPPESGPNVLVLATGFLPAGLWFQGGHVSAFGLALSAPTSTSTSNPLLYETEIFEADGSRHDTALLLTTPGLTYLGFVETAGSPGIAEAGIIVSPGTSAIAFDDVSHSAVMPGSFPLITPTPFAAVPGPGSWLLFGLGLIAVIGLRSRAFGVPAQDGPPAGEYQIGRACPMRSNRPSLMAAGLILAGLGLQTASAWRSSATPDIPPGLYRSERGTQFFDDRRDIRPALAYDLEHLVSPGRSITGGTVEPTGTFELLRSVPYGAEIRVLSGRYGGDRGYVKSWELGEGRVRPIGDLPRTGKGGLR